MFQSAAEVNYLLGMYLGRDVLYSTALQYMYALRSIHACAWSQQSMTDCLSVYPSYSVDNNTFNHMGN